MMLQVEDCLRRTKRPSQRFPSDSSPSRLKCAEHPRRQAREEENALLKSGMRSGDRETSPRSGTARRARCRRPTRTTDRFHSQCLCGRIRIVSSVEDEGEIGTKRGGTHRRSRTHRRGSPCSTRRTSPRGRTSGPGSRGRRCPRPRSGTGSCSTASCAGRTRRPARTGTFARRSTGRPCRCPGRTLRRLRGCRCRRLVGYEGGREGVSDAGDEVVRAEGAPRRTR